MYSSPFSFPFSFDLLLLASWGPCGEPGAVPPPRSVQDCIQRYGFDPVRFAACIEGMYREGTP